MKTRTRRTAAALILPALLTAVAASITAQQASSATTTADGAFTDAQSQRGETVAGMSCVVCHGDKLAGADIGPALQGNDFLSNWTGKTAGDLFEKTQMTMPYDAPGTLSPQQYADLVAYILKLNKFTAGATELGTDVASLRAIQIRRAP